MKLVYCPGCLEKQREIDRLKEENRRLKAQLQYQHRKATEGPFGSSTPSSKIPVKPNSLEERQAKRGGAKPGQDSENLGCGKWARDSDPEGSFRQCVFGGLFPEREAGGDRKL